MLLAFPMRLVPFLRSPDIIDQGTGRQGPGEVASATGSSPNQADRLARVLDI